VNNTFIFWYTMAIVAFAAFVLAVSIIRSRRARTFSGDQIGHTGVNVAGRSTMGTVTINGRTFSGNNLTMRNGRIIVDGKDVTDDTGVDMATVLEVKITGEIGSLECDKSVTVVGAITGNVDARGSVTCDDVGGDVKAGGSANTNNVKGNVYANGSVNCDKVGGSVQAGGSVNHG